jgi:LacI family transcriptional regulator
VTAGPVPSGRITSRRVAEISGVSQTTVSRVLANHPNVSETTRARVLRVLNETGYAPNLAARTMRTGSTGAIGVVIGRVTNPFYPMLAEALHQQISQSGRTMSVWISDGGPDDSGELAALSAVRERAIDGVIYTTVTAQSRSLRAALELHAPVVLLNRTLTRLHCDRVATDNRGGAAAAARHLIELGHRRIAVVAGPRSVSTAREREDGFVSELAAHGITLSPSAVVRGDFTHAAGRRALGQLLTDGPTAVFCVNDIIAFGVLDEARARGILVPGTLSVMGFDDTDMAAWPAFALTTVQQPSRQMAELGVRRLMQRIADPSIPPRLDRLPASLIVRGSTARQR